MQTIALWLLIWVATVELVVIFFIDATQLEMLLYRTHTKNDFVQSVWDHLSIFSFTFAVAILIALFLLFYPYLENLIGF